MRPDKINYYLDQAETVGSRSTCLRRKYGAIIVKNDETISTGYNGSPRGCKNCCDLGFCYREAANIPPGERYEMCRSVHAEQNAVLSAKRAEMIDSALFLVGIDYKTGEYSKHNKPCKICSRLIINSGITIIYMRKDKNSYDMLTVEDLIAEMDDDLEVLRKEVNKIQNKGEK